MVCDRQAADRVSEIAVGAAKEVSERVPKEADKASEALHEGAKKVWVFLRPSS